MRQWMVDPSLMCSKHLGGEHVEHHMFIGTLKKNISVQGYLEGGLLDISTLKDRHHELVVEMLARGGRHKSPLPEIDLDQYVEQYKNTPPRIDIEENLRELCRRCPNCKDRIRSSIRSGSSPDLWDSISGETQQVLISG